MEDEGRRPHLLRIVATKCFSYACLDRSGREVVDCSPAGGEFKDRTTGVLGCVVRFTNPRSGSEHR